MLTKDVDLLVYEPGLFKVWRVEHQQRGKGGDGVLNGTAFSAASGNFVNAGVQVGDVVTLASIDGMIDGCYEVVGVVSATQLTVSVVRADATLAAIPVGSGNSLIWRVSTFGPQRAMAERRLLDRLGLEEDSLAMLDEQSLWRVRTAAVSAAMVMIFEALYQEETDEDMFGRKKEIYAEAVEATVARLRLEFDADGDGDVDQVVCGDAVQMERD